MFDTWENRFFYISLLPFFHCLFFQAQQYWNEKKEMNMQVKRDVIILHVSIRMRFIQINEHFSIFLSAYKQRIKIIHQRKKKHIVELFSRSIS